MIDNLTMCSDKQLHILQERFEDLYAKHSSNTEVVNQLNEIYKELYARGYGEEAAYN